MLVPLCYLSLSVKEDKSPLSPISNAHVIRELNPIVVTMPSISSSSLPNFYTFFP